MERKGGFIQEEKFSIKKNKTLCNTKDRVYLHQILFSVACQKYLTCSQLTDKIIFLTGILRKKSGIVRYSYQRLLCR